METMKLLADIQSVWTVVVMVFFIGIFLWTFQGSRKEEFDEAAKLPFDQDDLDMTVGVTTREKKNG